MQEKRNNIRTELLTSIQLEKEADFEIPEIGLFDCGDDDLNEFIRNDAWNYKRRLLAETYLFYPTELADQNIFKPVAYASVCNDAITVVSEERKGEKRLFFKTAIQKRLPNSKRFFRSFPAVKIARLAVVKSIPRQGLGSEIINIFKKLFLTENRTGCLFLTVDAYNTPYTLSFYKKNGFDYVLNDENVEMCDSCDWIRDCTQGEPNEDDDRTKIMYFDLSTFTLPPLSRP